MIDTTTLDSYEDRIHNAYRRVIAQQGGQPGDWVTLTDLRPEIGGHREHVDAALLTLSRSRQANLIAQANQKILTEHDRDCAVRVGIDDCHLISIH